MRAQSDMKSEGSWQHRLENLTCLCVPQIWLEPSLSALDLYSSYDLSEYLAVQNLCWYSTRTLGGRTDLKQRGAACEHDLAFCRSSM